MLEFDRPVKAHNILYNSLQYNNASDYSQNVKERTNGKILRDDSGIEESFTVLHTIVAYLRPGAIESS